MPLPPSEDREAPALSLLREDSEEAGMGWLGDENSPN